MLTTRATEVSVISDVAAPDAFLAPYETGQEAIYKVLATQRSQRIGCDSTRYGTSRALPGGFEVRTVSGSTCGAAGL